MLIIKTKIAATAYGVIKLHNLREEWYLLGLINEFVCVIPVLKKFSFFFVINPTNQSNG